jgi:glucose-6-phosphate 1-dehydrogenase
MSCSLLVIFGATGDLTHRKLLPALYFLESERVLQDDFRILCIARKQKQDADFRAEATDSIRKYSRIKVKDDLLYKTTQRISYFQLDFEHKKDYDALREHIGKLTGRQCSDTERIFYLAIPSELFGVVVQHMDESKLAAEKGGTTRVVFEKPFGSDLGSAKKLNKIVTSLFAEEQIYRIDHYLAKELVQNLIVMRFGNSIFEPLWNKQYIDHVQITVAETLGVEHRAGYYEKAGSLRDVVQNHILQLLCLVGMGAPKSLNADDIRDAKVKVLRSIAKTADVREHSVRGQYVKGEIEGQQVQSYRDEEGIPFDSVTDTYFALKLHLNNTPWKNVPFYVRTGKRLKERGTEIVIVYKEPASKLFRERGHALESNTLVVRVQPEEGIIFNFNAKVPGNKVIIEQVAMEFCHECKFGPNSPEAYERLLHDVMQGDQTLFTRWDEVEHSWKLIDRIAKTWEGAAPSPYEAGTWGPKEADKLIEKDGRKWIAPKKPAYAALLGK